MSKKTPKKDRRPRLSKAALDAMIEEATVDAYDQSEQANGLHAMISEHLEVPFETKVLGVEVTVTRFVLRERGLMVAICSRGRDRQAIPLLDLPLPSPRPAGAEWIDAYRHWLGKG